MSAVVFTAACLAALLAPAVVNHLPALGHALAPALGAVILALFATFLISIAIDRSDRVGARTREDRVRQSEFALNEAQRIAQLGSWEWDVASDTFVASDEAIRILGFRPRSGRGLRRRLDEMCPDDAQRLQADFVRSLRNGTPFEVEVELRLPSGDRLCVTSRGEPIQLDAGKPVGFRGTIHDITARKRAEQALACSEHRYRTVIEHLPEQIFLKDVNSRLVSVNGGFARLARCEPGEMVGKTAHDLLPRDVAERIRSDDVRIISSGRAHEYEEEVVSAEGGRSILRTTKVPVYDEQGSVSGILGLVTDITDRRCVEQTVARQQLITDAVLAAMPGVLFLVDRAGHLIHWNPRLEDLTDYSAEKLARLTASNLFDSFDGPELGHSLRRAMGGEQVILEAKLAIKDGRHLLLNMTLTGVDVAADRYVLATGVDVTASRRTEAQLRQKDIELGRQRQLLYERQQTLSRRLLETQENERRRLARELHDELGQLLTAAKIHLQSTQRFSPEGHDPERLKEVMQLMDDALARVRSLSLELRPPVLDDLGLLSALRWLVNRYASPAGLEAQLNAEDVPVRLDSAVETACFRVAQEALTNVIRHAHASSVRIDLRLLNEALHLHIQDDGVGFDVRQMRRTAGEGGHLGLMGIEERAALVGGSVIWSSSPGHGTHVHAWFGMKQVVHA